LDGEVHEHRDSDLDLAVVSIPASFSPTGSSFGYDVLGKANAIIENSVVRVFSHGSGRLWLVSREEDRVVSREDHVIAFQTQSVSRGSSGGALLDRDGLLVGMIVEDDSRVAKATSISAALRALRGWKYAVSLREPAGPPQPTPNSGTVVEYPNAIAAPSVREERYSNTIFQIPAGWARQRHPSEPNRIMLTSTQDYFRETQPRYWIEITQSGRLQGDFEEAFKASLRPQGYEPVLGPTGVEKTDKGFTFLYVRGEMRNQSERIYFVQVSANPGDRYEEIVFCARDQYQSEQFTPVFLQFLKTVDYENTRQERMRR